MSAQFDWNWEIKERAWSQRVGVNSKEFCYKGSRKTGSLFKCAVRSRESVWRWEINPAVAIVIG